MFLGHLFPLYHLLAIYSSPILHSVAWYFLKLKFGSSLYIPNPNLLVFMLQIFPPGLLFRFLKLYRISLCIFSVRRFTFWAGHIYWSFLLWILHVYVPFMNASPQVINIFLYIFSCDEACVFFWLRALTESMCSPLGIRNSRWERILCSYMGGNHLHFDFQLNPTAGCGAGGGGGAFRDVS